ncbi:ParB/Srx family N-terminal domain-containing protein [Acinetobacter brisouii]|uniref:ParB/Srx family N-terminal domain-containing protein n=1 Tax=Acinetobacter brisouii TaxID=396323 RepID=UPI00124F5D35|nr:ParB/Srx family N-terminal domain-containing protein [Acinetobacter brisouii]
MKEIKVEMRPLDEVHPYELNAKLHDPTQVERIAKSIAEFGWDQPIVVDKDGVIIKGHGRRLAAIHLGLINVPVLIRDDLSEDQVRAARLADNRVALSDIDATILQKELDGLNFDLNGIFDAKELDFIVADLSEVNFDSVVLDLNEAIENHELETKSKVEEIKSRPILLEKILGFKKIEGKDERAVVYFMALAEEKTGLTGADAFVKFVSEIVEQAA